jgi:RHS repeat-associated protein
MDYDAFGMLINGTGNTPVNHLYAGEYFDEDLQMYYNRARYFNQATGRFFTLDSYPGNKTEPLSLHKYVYTNDNPVNGIDPSGKMTLIETSILVLGVLALAALATQATQLTRLNRLRVRPFPFTDPYGDYLEKLKEKLQNPTSPSPAPIPGPEPEPEQEYIDVLPDLDDVIRNGFGAVNLDTGTATALISVRGDALVVQTIIRAEKRGRQMVMCETAYREFIDGVNRLAGPLERFNATTLLAQIQVIPDTPSARALALPNTRRMGMNDKIIFGTGDSLGLRTYSSDANFVSAAASHGVTFIPRPFIHPGVQFGRF